jgi:hypothetical protein
MTTTSPRHTSGGPAAAEGTNAHRRSVLAVGMDLVSVEAIPS